MLLTLHHNPTHYPTKKKTEISWLSLAIFQASDGHAKFFFSQSSKQVMSYLELLE